MAEGYTVPYIWNLLLMMPVSSSQVFNRYLSIDGFQLTSARPRLDRVLRRCSAAIPCPKHNNLRQHGHVALSISFERTLLFLDIALRRWARTSRDVLQSVCTYVSP